MSKANWTFFTNHTHVMTCLAKNPEQSLREVALAVGVTERAVQRIVSDLEEGGYLIKEKMGRQNTYKLVVDKPLRHELEQHRTIGDILNILDRG